MDFAGLFKVWCAKRGIAPPAGALSLGYTKDSGSKWARGSSRPPRNKVPELAAKMGIRPAVLTRALKQSRDSK